MQWNISAEFVSAIVTLVILVYSSSTNAVPTPRNKLFRLCLNVTFVSIVLDIISAICIEQAAYLPLWVGTGNNKFVLFDDAAHAGDLYYLYFNADI